MTTSSEYIFVSDLHFGGDGQLQVCDYADEFIAFLKELARRDGQTELIVAGDTFGFWELTTAEGTDKLDQIVTQHQAIFNQFKVTGEVIEITMIPGNHDYDLACIPEFQKKLRAYNITLDPSTALVRRVRAGKIWIENGKQVDPFNASPDYGNPYALPNVQLPKEPEPELTWLQRLVTWRSNPPAPRPIPPETRLELSRDTSG